MLDFYRYFFFNDTATTEIYTLSLHDALPICVLLPVRLALRLGQPAHVRMPEAAQAAAVADVRRVRVALDVRRSEEHTSELQSRQYLVCRLLLEKKTIG